MNGLTALEIGPGRVAEIANGWRLTLPPITAGYADAQLDDTRGRRRTDLLHRPPLRLSLEARATAPGFGGTLGFGFWNDSFPSLGGAAGSDRLLPASPQALWFFGRWSPSDLPFAPDGEGIGWCAAALRTPPLPGAAVAALGAALAAAMLLPPVRRAAIGSFWRRSSGHQRTLDTDLAGWHRYSIDWQPALAELAVDGNAVLRVKDPPPGPLGLVLWIDNQWAAFSADRGLRFGIVPTSVEARLEIRDLRLTASSLGAGQRDS